jgi:hypothetical protein
VVAEDGLSFATMVGESAQAHGASRNKDNRPLHVVAERRNTERVSQHELQILRETVSEFIPTMMDQLKPLQRSGQC